MHKNEVERTTKKKNRITSYNIMQLLFVEQQIIPLQSERRKERNLKAASANSL